MEIGSRRFPGLITPEQSRATDARIRPPLPPVTPKKRHTRPTGQHMQEEGGGNEKMDHDSFGNIELVDGNGIIPALVYNSLLLKT